MRVPLPRERAHRFVRHHDRLIPGEAVERAPAATASATVAPVSAARARGLLDSLMCVARRLEPLVGAHERECRWRVEVRGSAAPGERDVYAVEQRDVAREPADRVE